LFRLREMQRRMRLNFGFNLYNMPQIPGLPGVRTMVHGGANVNQPPVGYELLKDSNGTPIKDSNGQYIYVLKS